MFWHATAITLPIVIAAVAAVLAYKSWRTAQEANRQSREALKTSLYDAADQQAYAVSVDGTWLKYDSEQEMFYRDVTVHNAGNYAIHNTIVVYRTGAVHHLADRRALVTLSGQGVSRVFVGSIAAHDSVQVKIPLPEDPDENAKQNVRVIFRESASLGKSKHYHRAWVVEEGNPPHLASNQERGILDQPEDA